MEKWRRMKGNNEINQINFWDECVGKSKEEIQEDLVEVLGEPKTELALSCLLSISKRIYIFLGVKKDGIYPTLKGKNYLMTSKVSEIVERVFQDGSKIGQVYYDLILDRDINLDSKIKKFQVWEENLEPSKWKQIKNCIIKDKELVFKYQKWLSNSLLVDFYPLDSVEVNVK